MCIVRFFLLFIEKINHVRLASGGNSAFYEVMLLEEPRDIIVPLVIIAQHAHLFFYGFTFLR